MIVGKEIIYFDSIDSTSDEARRRIKGGEGEGLVVVASEQTAGRGKPGSIWHSPPGNFYLSAVIRPYRNPGELVSLTLLSAVAVSAALGRFSDLPIVVKWPNDLMAGGKKLGGILVEGMASGHLIIGIGVNLAIIPEDMRDRATSIYHETGKMIERDQFSAAVLQELDRFYLAYLGRF